MTAVRLESGIDAGAVAHYGDPLREQRGLLDGGARVDLTHRDVLEITGPERLSWLHALTAQAFDALTAGEPVAALLLDPNGHIEHVLLGVDDGATMWVHTEPGAGAALAGFLQRMIFMTRVEVRERPDLGIVWAPEAIAGFPARRAEQGGVELFVPVAEVEQVLGERRAGTWAHAALRIAAGVPRIGVDTDARTIPNEIGLYATALDKGCYRGQETVARVHNLGRPPRRLVRLSMDGSEDRLPDVGADVCWDGRVVGRVGESARHFEEGPVALALVKRAVPVDATLEVGGIAAAQEALVDPDVGLHVRPRLAL